MLYLKPEARITAQEALADFSEAVRDAQYEFTAAITTAKALGLTWDEIGQALGMTKAGASQLHKRNAHVARLEVLTECDPLDPTEASEFDRFARKLGATGGKVRYEVRQITSGRKGVTRVVRETVSRHRDLLVAERRCDEMTEAGARPELWAVYPDGSEFQREVRSIAQRALDTVREQRPPADEDEAW